MTYVLQIRDRQTVFTWLYPLKVQARLPGDQSPTKPANRLVAGKNKLKTSFKKERCLIRQENTQIFDNGSVRPHIQDKTNQNHRNKQKSDPY